MPAHDPHQIAARFVREAGGQLVGRTRLQKVAYLTQLAGFGDDLDFEYRHYGPFSEDLATGMEIAAGLGMIKEEEKRAEWGGRYSVYQTTEQTPPAVDATRSAFVAAAAKIGAIELELAATAAFLFVTEGCDGSPGKDPWQRTAELKPDKAANGRLELAKLAYRGLAKLKTHQPLPAIA
ncbi:MAG: hypothetical protein NT133_14655 [Alphaproteobacteria bacterium]|nr:hypothetical protein [Alphaproteobacteria bacterium]